METAPYAFASFVSFKTSFQKVVNSDAMLETTERMRKAGLRFASIMYLIIQRLNNLLNMPPARFLAIPPEYNALEARFDA